MVGRLPQDPDHVAQIRALVGLPRDAELAEIRRRLAGDHGDETAEDVGRIGTPAAVAILEAALGDPDPRVRLAAARGLRAAGPAAAQAVDALVARLDDPCWAVLEEIAGVLGDLGADAIGAARPIERMLWDEVWRSQVEADVGPRARAALGSGLADLIDARAGGVRLALMEAVERIRGDDPAP